MHGWCGAGPECRDDGIHVAIERPVEVAGLVVEVARPPDGCSLVAGPLEAELAHGVVDHGTAEGAVDLDPLSVRVAYDES